MYRGRTGKRACAPSGRACAPERTDRGVAPPLVEQYESQVTMGGCVEFRTTLRCLDSTSYGPKRTWINEFGVCGTRRRKNVERHVLNKGAVNARLVAMARIAPIGAASHNDCISLGRKRGCNAHGMYSENISDQCGRCFSLGPPGAPLAPCAHDQRRNAATPKNTERNLSGIPGKITTAAALAAQTARGLQEDPHIMQARQCDDRVLRTRG